MSSKNKENQSLIEAPIYNFFIVCIGLIEEVAVYVFHSILKQTSSLFIIFCISLGFMFVFTGLGLMIKFDKSLVDRKQYWTIAGMVMACQLMLFAMVTMLPQAMENIMKM